MQTCLLSKMITVRSSREHTDVHYPISSATAARKGGDFRNNCPTGPAPPVQDALQIKQAEDAAVAQLLQHGRDEVELVEDEEALSILQHGEEVECIDVVSSDLQKYRFFFCSRPSCFFESIITHG